MDSFVFLGCPSGPSKKPTAMHAVKSEWIELEGDHSISLTDEGRRRRTRDNEGRARGSSRPLSTSYGPCRNPMRPTMTISCDGIRKAATRADRVVPQKRSTSLLVTSSIRFSTLSAGRRKRGGRYWSLKRR